MARMASVGFLLTSVVVSIWVASPTTQPHLVVSKEPRDQAADTFARLRVKLDGDTLSRTPVANSRGPIVAGVTSRYVRVE